MLVTIPGKAATLAFMALRSAGKADGDLDLHAEVMPTFREHVEGAGADPFNGAPALTADFKRSEFNYIKRMCSEMGSKNWELPGIYPDALVEPRIALRDWLADTETAFKAKENEESSEE